MLTFQDKRAEVSQARRRLRSVEERLHITRSRAAARGEEEQAALRRGESEANRADTIRREIEQLQADLDQDGFGDACRVLPSMTKRSRSLPNGNR